MTWAALIAPVLGFLKALIAPITAWRGGRKAEQAAIYKRRLDEIENAVRAIRRLEFDDDYRRELRRKYRNERD